MATSDLMKAPKEKLVSALERLGAAAKRHKDTIKQKAEDTAQVGFSAAGGGLAGWYMGGLTADIQQDASLATVEQKEEAMKLFGTVDRDLAAGAVLVGLGLSGMAGKKASGAVTSVGTGILSYYIGSKAFDAARDRRLENA